VIETWALIDVTYLKTMLYSQNNVLTGSVYFKHRMMHFIRSRPSSACIQEQKLCHNMLYMLVQHSIIRKITVSCMVQGQIFRGVQGGCAPLIVRWVLMAVYPNEMFLNL
jgi:hypothetical protein